MPDFVEEIAFDDARDFLAYLQMSAPQWGAGPMCTWVFRGQGDASWPLLPSAWREPWHSLLRRLSIPHEPFLREEAERIGSLVKYLLSDARAKTLATKTHDRYISNVASLLNRTASELFAIDQFVELADNVGLRIPAAPTSIYNDYMFRLRSLHIDAIIRDDGGNEWFSPVPYDIFGLAQHHRVPTRLLDFTSRSFVAAYFAARDPKGPEIAVWAVNLIYLAMSRAKTLTCRRYDNTFLHAQDGIFLYDPEAPYDYVCTGEWPSLEVALRFGRRLEATVIRKVTLPASRAQHLLGLLWRERVSPAHLMPTYDNISDALPQYWNLLENAWKYD
jgi:hypothetical protein